MEVYKRRQKILSLLDDQGEVGVDELAARFEMSSNTIRNDLKAMAAEEQLKRVRGGAIASESAISGSTTNDFAIRLNQQRTAKRLMGAWAAQFVHDGDGIILDASSTVYQMATFLKDRRDLTVVTNGLETAMLLARNPGNRVILAANHVRPNAASLAGDLNPNLLHHINASKFFVSSSGFTVEQGLMEVDIDEGPLKAEMLPMAEQVIALVDHSKFGQRNTYRFAAPNQIHHLIVDDGISDDDLQHLRKHASYPVTVVGEAKTDTYRPGQISTAEQSYLIGFANLTERMIFAKQVRRSIAAAAERYGNIKLLIKDNALDHHKAVENADWFVAQKVDLMIEYQIDVQASNIIMDKFDRAGIPVIAIDIPHTGATFYGVDNFKAGRLAGEALGRWIVKNWGGRLDILLRLETSLAGPVPGGRLLGQQIGLESTLGFLADKEIITVDTPGIIDPTLAAVQKLLPTLPQDVKIGIIPINDEAALGALTAFEQAGRLDQVVAVGQGADTLGLAALRRSDYPLIGTTRYCPENYGDQVISLATKILKGESVPPAVYNHHVFITRENLNDYYPA